MHIITQKRIKEAQIQFKLCEQALDGWRRIIEKNSFKNFAQLKKVFNSVDKVDDLYVFDIGGNKLRLVTSIHFNRQKIYIRHILSHKDYDKNKWLNRRRSK